MNRQSAAYLRRSEEGGITKEDEIARLRDLAHREGHDGDLAWYDDWGHSADEGKDAQRELTRLIADMRAGRIGTVYAGKVDRLARSVAVFARFAAAARERDVRLVTVAEGDLSEARVETDPFAWGSRQFMVTMAEMELRTIKARVHRAQRVRVERGDRFGHPAYGWRHVRDERGAIVREPDPARPASVVVDAYREVGSIMGAAKLLQKRGIPAPKGGRRWGQSTVTRIIEAEAPDLLPRRGPSGRRTPTHALLAQLLICHCGATMTPNLPRGQYYCPMGHRLGAAVHGRMAVREADVLPWVMAETAHLRQIPPAVKAGTNEAQRADLAAKRGRWIEQYGEGLIDKATRDARLAGIERDLGKLDAAQEIAAIPWPIHWDWPPAELNSLLRAGFFIEVRLGPDLLPLPYPDGFVWRDPSLRGD